MRESMSLIGGINMYSGPWGERYESDEVPKGRKVIFLNENGYDGQRERARKYFTEGQILEIEEIYVGRSESTVEFVDCPGERFNSVMFADVEPIENNKVDSFAPSYISNNMVTASHLPSSIIFPGEGNAEIMRLNPNGDIFVNGNLAENDKEVVDALRNFLFKGRH